MDELYHYGIKGQKWGVRRYQNKDGTLTNLGKKRKRKDLSYEDAYKTGEDVTLKKGTTLYRVTSSKNEKGSDRKYYSLDKDEYTNGYFVNKNTYRNEYKLTKDIVIAGYNTTNKILADIGSKPFRDEYADSKYNNSLTNPDFNMSRSGPYEKFRKETLKRKYAGIVDPVDSNNPIGMGFTSTPTVLYVEDILKKIGSEKLWQ